MVYENKPMTRSSCSSDSIKLEWSLSLVAIRGLVKPACWIWWVEAAARLHQHLVSVWHFCSSHLKESTCLQRYAFCYKLLMQYACYLAPVHHIICQRDKCFEMKLLLLDNLHLSHVRYWDWTSRSSALPFDLIWKTFAVAKVSISF